LNGAQVLTELLFRGDELSVFDERAKFSRSNLERLQGKLTELGADSHQACVYATGSVARGEASPSSDLDLFIVDTADQQRGELPLSNIDSALLRADLIRAGTSLGLPPFSGDGIYLEVHTLADLIGNTGNRLDDYTNSFTARLLLMLESNPILNEEAHRKAREAVVGSYWRDYRGKNENFLPVFLVNDIMRYWKTLCLNYEGERNSGTPSGYDAERWRNRNRLKDVKLKFSRMWICHTAIAYLLWRSQPGGAVSPNDALEMMKCTPRERLLKISDAGVETTLVEGTLSLYEWFLGTVPSGKEEAYEWVASRDNWEEARSRGQAFGDMLFELLDSFRSDSPLYRFLIG
jgi:hypothetical protein